MKMTEKEAIKKFKKTTIQFAQWDITSLCNLRCRHCRAWKLPKDNELSTKESINLLKQLAGLKVKFLNLSGGEPFLRKDIFVLLEHTRNFDSVTITSNGTALDKYSIKKLKAFKNLRISLSLDGMENFHDDFRQVRGTFKKAINAIKNLTESSIPTTVKFTLTKFNKNEALKVFDLVSRYRIESLNFRAVLPAGRANKSIMPTSEQYKKVSKELLAMSKEKKVPVISGDPILFPLFPELMGEIWNRLEEKVFTNIYAGCLAGDEIIYIKPNGDVGVCAYIPRVVGNITKTPLIKLINETFLFRQLNNCHDKLEGMCGKCKHRYLCGGCRAAALVINKNILAEDSRCLLYSNK